MRRTMSEEQRAQGDAINKIAEEISVIKRWWPVIALFGTIVGGTMTLTGLFYKYDSSKATKQDIAVVSKQVSDLQASMKELSDKFTRHTAADSVDKITTTKQLNGRIDDARNNIERLFKLLEKRGVVAYYTQKYSISPEGNRQIQNVQHHAYNR